MRRRLPDAQLLLSVHLKLKTAEAAAPTRLGALMQARLIPLRRHGALVPHRAAEARLAPEKLLGPAPTPPVVQHATALLLADTTAAAELLPAPALCTALQYARARARRCSAARPPPSRSAAHCDRRAERRRRRRDVGVAAPADAARAPFVAALLHATRRDLCACVDRAVGWSSSSAAADASSTTGGLARSVQRTLAATAPHVLGRRRRRRGCVPLRCARMPRAARRGVDQRGAR